MEIGGEFTAEETHDAQWYQNCQKNLDFLYEVYKGKIKEIHNKNLDPKTEREEYMKVIKEFEKKVSEIRGDVILEEET